MKKHALGDLTEVPVPFDSDQMKIAVVQLAGSQSVRKPAFVSGRDTFVWPAGEEVPERCRKAERILAHIAETYPGVNLVILPEYSLPIEPLLTKLQRFADHHRVVIIAGSDTFPSSRGKIYNQCPVFIPNHKNPVWVRKRDLAPAETGPVDAFENHNPVFRWKANGIHYWFSIHIGRDFKPINMEAVQSIAAPGFFVVPMSSSDVPIMRTYADELLSSELGRAAILCNTADSYSSGNSSVMAMTAHGQPLSPVIEIPKQNEHLLIFELDCAKLAAQRKQRARIDPIGYPYHLVPIVRSALTYDFLPEIGSSETSIGIINPELFQSRGVQMRMAFLAVPNYTEIVEKMSDRHFEILAVLGQEDIVVSHLGSKLELAYDLKPIGAHFSSDLDGSDENEERLPYFEVHTYFKVLGHEVTKTDRVAFRRGTQPDPNEEELAAIFALGRNWNTTAVHEDQKRLFLERRWILGDTREIPGEISAIMTLTLDQATSHHSKVFDTFEQGVLPEIVKRSEVKTVFAGFSIKSRMDYVLRINIDLKGIYPLIEFVHRTATAHRILVTTTTYVVVNKISSLALEEACSSADAGREHFVYYHLWKRLESSAKRSFKDLSAAEQNNVIHLFDRAERVLLTFPGASAAEQEVESTKALELLAEALVTASAHRFGDSFNKLHGMAERQLDEQLTFLAPAEIEKLASEVVPPLPAGKVAKKMTYGEKIRVLRVAAGKGVEIPFSTIALEALATTVEVRNKYSHQRQDEITSAMLVQAIQGYGDFFAGRSNG
jgi:hypothetical protein